MNALKMVSQTFPATFGVMNKSDLSSFVDGIITTYNESIGDGNGNETDGDLACYTIEKGSDKVILSEKICVFVSLTLVIIGLVGNFCSFLVFSSKEMRVISSNVYLLVLACSDSFYLISVLSAKILSTLRCLYFTASAIDFYNRSMAWCKIFQYILDLCSNYSTCLIMAFTIERFIAVYLPIRFKEICTVQRARIICAVTLITTAVLISPHHFMYISLLPQKNVCLINPHYEQQFWRIYIAEMSFFRIIPVFIIAVLNITIIMRLSMVNREKRRLKNSRTPLNSNNRKKQKGKKKQKDDKNLQITVMLIMVSTSYIIVFLPVLIHFIMWALQREKFIELDSEAMVLAQRYTGTLYISGFAINFFLYTISGKVFREQMLRILCERDIRIHQQKITNNGQTSITHCPEATTLV